MRQLPALLCGVLVVTAALAAAAGGAAAADGDALSIQSLEVSPDSPVPGEIVTFSPTVAATGQTVTVDRVVVRTADGETLASTENAYSLTAGERATVAVSGQLPPGETHNLRVVVVGRTTNGRTVEASKPVTIEVDRVAPNVAVDGNPVAGTESSLSLRVSNTLGVEMENVRLELAAEGVEVRGNGFDPALSPGETTTFNYTVVADEPGTVQLEARLVFTTQADDRRTVVQTITVDVEPLEDAVTVSASVSDEDEDTLDVTVANHGDALVDDVEVTATAGGERVDRTLLDDVEGHGTRSASLDVSDAPDDAAVTVRVEYTVGNTDGSVDTTVQLEPDEGQVPGEIRLTGVNVVPENGVVRISGSAANVGLTQVNATIVSVVDTGSVTPAQPNRDFFVGPVPANDFVSFDVYATVEGNVSSIPLRITYLVDGERVERTVEVPVGEAIGGGADPAPRRPSRSGGLPVIPIVAAVVVVGLAVVVWRRRS